MKIFSFLQRNKKNQEKGTFADFFLSAPLDQKKAVIREAAEKANKDQMETFKRANLEIGQKV